MKRSSVGMGSVGDRRWGIYRALRTHRVRNDRAREASNRKGRDLSARLRSPAGNREIASGIFREETPTGSRGTIEQTRRRSRSRNDDRRTAIHTNASNRGGSYVEVPIRS